MGYDLHITRRAEWSADGPDIELSEWLSVVENDPELRLDEAATASSPEGLAISLRSQGLAAWTGHALQGGDSGVVWFDHRRGAIVVKIPDAEVIRKMLDIAKSLGARVQVDDGEFYH